MRRLLVCAVVAGCGVIAPHGALAQLGGVTDTLTDTVNDVTSTLTGGGTSTSSGDTTPPAVTMTSPRSGQTVSGTITVSANASDSGSGIAVVDFLLDTPENRINQQFEAPYEFSWNSATVGNGSHTIAAVARDRAGNETVSALVTFTVANGTTSTGDTTGPTVTMTSPAPGATVRDTITVSANASDPSGIAMVEFFRANADGTNVVSLKQELVAPYEFPWDTTTVADGSYQIAAVARDKAGNEATSPVITIAVANSATTGDATPPTVTMTAPSNGATVKGTAVPVSANASDNVGVVVVEFFQQQQPADGSTPPPPTLIKQEFFAPYEASWNTTTGVPDGQYRLAAVARDKAGNVATSPVITVTVANSTTPPPPTTTRTELESLPAGTLKGPTGEPVPPDQSWGALGEQTAAFSPPGCTGFCAAASNIAGSTATFTFTGTEVSWIGLRCNVCGIANVSIDGVDVGSPVDTAGPGIVDNDPNTPPPTSEPVFTASGLAAGITHTLVITVTGTTNSDAAFVVIDAFDVTQ